MCKHRRIPHKLTKGFFQFVSDSDSPVFTHRQGSWVRYPVWQHTFVSPSAFSRRTVVSYWRKYVHEVLVNRLGGLSLPRKSVVRLTDRPDLTLDVYRGHKNETMQQQCNALACPFSRDVMVEMAGSWMPLLAS